MGFSEQVESSILIIGVRTTYMRTVVDKLETGCWLHLELLFCDYFYFLDEMEEK